MDLTIKTIEKLARKCIMGKTEIVTPEEYATRVHFNNFIKWNK